MIQAVAAAANTDVSLTKVLHAPPEGRFPGFLWRPQSTKGESVFEGEETIVKTIFCNLQGPCETGETVNLS